MDSMTVRESVPVPYLTLLVISVCLLVSHSGVEVVRRAASRVWNAARPSSLQTRTSHPNLYQPVESIQFRLRRLAIVMYVVAAQRRGGDGVGKPSINS